ncbi:MAG: hypothetical protein IPL28_26460 [Chloroflexi bacterium]|nr:hypothetical protein [Chloroflexota bacterium]
MSGQWLVVSGKWAWVKRLVPAGVIVGVAITSLGGLRPDYLPIVDEEVTAEAIAQYEWFTGNIGTTINHEYLTPPCNPPVSSAWLEYGQRWRAQPTAGTAEATLMNQRTTNRCAGGGT